MLAMLGYAVRDAVASQATKEAIAQSTKDSVTALLSRPEYAGEAIRLEFDVLLGVLQGVLLSPR